MIAWLVPHMPVVFGLAAGTLAKFGLDLDGGMLIARKAVAHMMMLAFLGLIAEAANDAVNSAPTVRAVVGASAALLSAQLVSRYRAWADQQAVNRLPNPGDPK